MDTDGFTELSCPPYNVEVLLKGSKQLARNIGGSRVVDEAPPSPSGQVSVDHFSRSIAPGRGVDESLCPASPEGVPDPKVKQGTASLLCHQRRQDSEKCVRPVERGEFGSQEVARLQEIDKLSLAYWVPQVDDAPQIMFRQPGSELEYNGCGSVQSSLLRGCGEVILVERP